jgi:hypothetical protein
MDWIIQKLPVLVVVLVVAARIIGALAKSRKAKTQHEAAHDPAEEQRRVAEVQEQIRRRIAERRGGAPVQPESPASGAPTARPVVRRTETPEPPDLVGKALRRVFEEVERKLQPAPAPEPPPLVSHRRAELERQQQLVDQMKALEETRTLVQRRATHLAEEEKAEAASETRILAVARARAMEDLRDPDALRRAFVLREVLGPPVGLR